MAEGMCEIFGSCGVPRQILTDQGSQFVGKLVSTLDRLDRFVIQYNMVMNPFKFDYSVDFVRTLTLGMLTRAIHIELLRISFSRWKVARFLSLPSLFR